MHGSDRINFHFYFAGISILDDSTLPLLQIACFSKKSRFHGNSCHSCYVVEILRTCQLHVNYESPNFSDFVLRIPILSYTFWATRICRCIFLHFARFCITFYVSRFQCVLHFYTFTSIEMLNVYIMVPILCASFSETFTKNRPSRVNRFRREGAIDDIGSSSELVCRVRARYIIESNFTVKSVRRPKLCLMAA